MQPLDIVYDICRHYIKDHAEVVDPRLCDTVSGKLRSRDIKGLSTCSRHFDLALHTVVDWKFLRQVEAFFKKNALLSENDVCTQAAKESFLTSEVKCSETNIRLKRYMDGSSPLSERYHQYLFKARRFIVSVLGDFNPFLNALPRLVRVTPGATSTAKRMDSLPQLKMKMQLYATRRAAPYLKSLYRLNGFREPRIRFTHSNRVELVPKNWKTHRTIACEPEGNLPLQLAFDTYAKRRLRRFGLDLSDQSANQKAAKHASIHNDLVTVDFSAASDTISYNTVSWLFPPDWFRFLSDVRTPSFRGVFGDGVYSKFSSMGNGSTFTIETLLFAAACNAVGSHNFLVYGDDVILEKEYYEEFVAFTRFLGFSINSEKSFHDGPFRESCGYDAFNGVEVTPLYIRSIDMRKASQSHLINTMSQLAFPDGHLEEYLWDLLQRLKLPFVPFNESSISGVWIHAFDARRLGLLRWTRFFGRDIDVYKAFCPKSRKRVFVDSRGYYLWFLNATDQVAFSGPWVMASKDQAKYCTTQTSSVPVFDHTYVRKRVRWIKPAMATPDHLDRWSERLAAR